ncbi:MAG: putative rRNA maturation factor [Luteibaculaceae bacterium]|jgi:probable rRNA maturation factor
MDLISFHSEDISFNLDHTQTTSGWIQLCIQKERKELGELAIIFCSDDYLHKMNVTYLNHDTLTDVITFDYSEHPVVSGDVFISIDRITENAKTHKTSFENELKRVIIHGVLHLIGFGDKSPETKEVMTSKEDFYLNLHP